MTKKTRDNLIYLAIALVIACSVYLSLSVSINPSTLKAGLRVGCLSLAIAAMLYAGIHQHKHHIRDVRFWLVLTGLLVVYGLVQQYLVWTKFRDPLWSLLLVGPEMFVFLVVLRTLLRYYRAPHAN
jgi:hypothetical protein